MSSAATRLEGLVEQLGYREAGGLVTSVADTMDPAQRQLFQEARRRIPGLAGVYFGRGSNPLAYFVAKDHLPPEERTLLHRRTWNDGRAPLLVCVTLDSVYVYNTMALPALRPEDLDAAKARRLLRHLSVTSNLLNGLQELRASKLESGETWRGKWAPAFKQQNRCAETLLLNLRATSQRLTDEELPQPLVHRLLLRTILILYLEQRAIFDPSFYAQVDPRKSHLSDFLSDKDAALALFDALAAKFNGDLFPVDLAERDGIQPRHFQLLARFLSGSEDLGTGQFWLWPFYDFSVIPIHMVSGIYELFLHHPAPKEDAHAKAANGAVKDGMRPKAAKGVGEHYTPPHLAELMLEEVLPWPRASKNEPYDVRVLDPACGSGMFLVESYRRLAARWQAAHGVTPGVPDLCGLLTRNIFGIDSNAEALRVAAFSLYLALLDHSEPKAILSDLRLPSLTVSRNGSPPNLEAVSAFHSAAVKSKFHFDLVVGNPPWKRNWMPTGAVQYLADRNLPSAKEGAHPFMWLAAECINGGRAALVTPTKWLFNQEGPDQAFRREFFARNEVETLINLSALRRSGGGSGSLFANAVGPATVVVFRSRTSAAPLEPVLYVAPKPHGDAAPTDHLVIRTSDLSWVPRAEAEGNSDVWKPLMWGSWRDVQLVRRLRKLPLTLGEYMQKRSWKQGRGFQLGGDKPDAYQLAELPRLDARELSHYTPADPLIFEPWFHGGFKRTGPRAIYRKPHVVFVRGKRRGRFGATFLDVDAAFNDTFVGVTGPPQDERRLKALAAYLNSRAVNYLLFMTVGEWGVERDRIPKGDILNLPAAPLCDERSVQALADLLDRWVTAPERAAVEANIDSHVSEALGLSQHEQLLIDDCVRNIMTLPGTPSAATQRQPTERARVEHLRAYASAFQSALVPMLNYDLRSHLRASLYLAQGSTVGSMAVVSFERRAGSADEALRVLSAPDGLDAVLNKLNVILRKRTNRRLFVERELRLYDEDSVFIVKPALAREWRPSRALADADAVLAEVLAGQGG